MKEQLIFRRKGFVHPYGESVVLLAVRLSVDKINDARCIRCWETWQNFLCKRINVGNHIPRDRLPSEHSRARQDAAGRTGDLIFTRGVEQLSRIKVKIRRPTPATEIDRLPREEGTEIPCLLIRSRDNRGPGLALSQSQSFVTSKNEGLIFANRTTHGKAKLVPDKLWPCRARNFRTGIRVDVVEGKEIAGVELLIAQVVPCGAVKPVRTGGGNHVHY